MDERRARIHDDLRGVIRGGLRFEPLERAPYAFDAGLSEVDPTGVVVPHSVDDVVHAVRYAAENGLWVHPRGAGTGRSGGGVGPGLVVDFGQAFRRVVDIQDDRVVVQAGVVLDDLNARLAPLGRKVGPDPLGSDVGTVGGMFGLDTAGPSTLRYGTIGDHVERVRVVFAGGDTAELGRELWPGFDDEPADDKGRVVRKLGAIVRRNLDLLMRRAGRPGAGSNGYPLAKAASGLGVHIPRILAGSEGTLALVTELTLRTVPVPPAQAALLLPFGRLADAASAVAECLDASPAACELFDWRLIHLARDSSASFREWGAENAEAALVLLFEGEEPDDVSGRAARLAEHLARRGRLVGPSPVVSRRDECERMMRLRREVEPRLLRLGGRARPTGFPDEVTVPPDALPGFLHRLQDAMRRLDLNGTIDAHAGRGRVHARPFLDPTDPDHLARLVPWATEVVEAALDLGGTVSGDVGHVPALAQMLRRACGDLWPVFREVRDAFDPLSLLNPGQVLGDESPEGRPWRSHPALRPDPEPAALSATSSAEIPTLDAPPVEPAPEDAVVLPVLRWGEPGLLASAVSCHACGACRTLDSNLRMCPTFRATRSEDATPRSKANLVRQIASGAVDPRLWGTDEFKAQADMCVHCNLCPKECPSGVDVSRLMLEAKAAYVENHGLSPADWWLSRVELWSRIASRLPILSNAVLASRPARWALDRLFGLSRLRRLPRAHRSPFTSRAGRLGLTRPRPQEPGPRVAYFVDVFANHFDQELAESVVAVLRQSGVNVYVPAGQRDSGMPALVAGDVEHARDLALVNLRVLGNAVRDGYTVVCSEPTSALMLRQEYLRLTDDLDAALVAENTLDVGQYLAGLAGRGQLPAPEHPIRARVGYHQPCHLRALDVGTPGLDLIRTIPELEVEFIDRGCSGMAGTFGLHRDHFRTSLRAGRGLLSRLRDADLELGATECSACRLQMEQGAPKRTLHPVKLLSLAYGLNPSLRRHLKDPKARHAIA